MNTAWQESALCAQTDPDTWFPERGGPGYATSRRICRRCPVRTECLTDALATETPGERHGMRGGLSPQQREAATRQVAA